MEEREKEILKLCVGVLYASPERYYNPNGADTTTCPFCSGKVLNANADIGEIKHTPDCAYLIAKDLTTGIDLSKI